MKRFVIFSLVASIMAGLVTYFRDRNNPESAVKGYATVDQVLDIARLKPASDAFAGYTKQFQHSAEVSEKEKIPSAIELPPDDPENTPRPLLPALEHQAERVAAENSSATRQEQTETTPQTATLHITAGSPFKQKVREGKTRNNGSAQLKPAPSTIAPEELQRSLADLEKIARQDPSAAYDLGLRYFRGDGVRQDSYRALQWMRDAAERGDIEAQKAVGRLYMTGLEEMGADLQEARKWLSIAAGRGDEEAEHLLLELGSSSSNDDAYTRSTYHSWYHAYPYRLYWHKGGWNYYR